MPASNEAELQRQYRTVRPGPLLQVATLLAHSGRVHLAAYDPIGAVIDRS